MASSRKTYDTDVITLRTVFAKNVVNSNIPALRVLTADGAGGTYWAIPSSLGLNPSFNEIITSAATYTADLSYNRFRLFAGEGIGMVNGTAGSNQTTIFGKAFNTVDVSGENSFYAFTSNTLTPNIRVATTGAIQARADPTTNTLFIDGPVSNPYIVSTGQYGFYQMKVIPQTSTVTSSIQGWSGDFITASSPSTTLNLLGYNDIKLSTNITTNSIYFSISTFTSQGYLNISTAAFTAYPNSISTVSSLYTPLDIFNSTVVSLSSYTGFSFSSVVSSIDALAMSTGDQFYILTGLINARATIIQLNSEINTVNNNIKSTVQGLGSSGYISTPGGGGGGITTANLVSTVEGLGSAGYISTAGGGGGITTANLVSTVGGLGTAGYLSSFSLLSTVGGLGSAGYLSSISLLSTVGGLGSAGYISSLSLQSSLVSTVFGFDRNILAPSLISTVKGLGSSDYISSLSLQSSLVSTVRGLGTNPGTILDSQIASTLQYSPYFSSVKLGYRAGFTTQGNNAIAIGNIAGSNTQGEDSIAIGRSAGRNSQGTLATAIGVGAGSNGQGFGATAIGFLSGYTAQGANAVGLGYYAGNEQQGANAVAIGLYSGWSNQGVNSVAIGKNAGRENQGFSSIVISALGDPLNASTEGFFVAPLRTVFNAYDYTLGYNSTTREIGMISNAIIPRFDSCPFDYLKNFDPSRFENMLDACNYTWNFGPGASQDGGSNYRVNISFGLTNATENILCYFRISNVTQTTTYTTATYGPANNIYFTSLMVLNGGTNYVSGSFTDIIQNATFNYGDTFQPQLLMKTASYASNVGLGSKLTFTMEVVRSGF